MLIFAVCIILCLAMGFFMYADYKHQVKEIRVEYENRLESYRIAIEKKPDSFGLNGIYYTNKYYCVWVQGMSESEIKNTQCHELCHHFVYMDYEHFCGNG